MERKTFMPVVQYNIIKKGFIEEESTCIKNSYLYCPTLIFREAEETPDAETFNFQRFTKEELKGVLVAGKDPLLPCLELTLNDEEDTRNFISAKDKLFHFHIPNKIVRVKDVGYHVGEILEIIEIGDYS